jgi:hypothetical protein
MRLHDGRYYCALCGELLDVPLLDDPHVIIHAASGRANVRILKLGTEEIHRCEVDPLETPLTRSVSRPAV